MRAAVLREVDGPFESPTCPSLRADGGVLVRVRAAGVNFADVMIRRGRYPQMPELPAVLGSEVAGELEDGTRVMALTPAAAATRSSWRSTRAGRAAARSRVVRGGRRVPAHVPHGVHPADAAGAHGPGSRARHAAAGGVGTAAIQVARGLGARVWRRSGRRRRSTSARAGAEAAYVYDELPEDRRVDVILDQVGGDFFAASFARLKPLGTVIAVGSAAGAWPPVEPARIVGRNVALAGFYLGRLLRLEPERRRRGGRRAARVLADGALQPLVGAGAPARRGRAGAALVESRQSVGKVVLIP